MAGIPEDRLYTEEHEWALNADGVVVVGITDHAQDALGDITYVELPEAGDELTINQGFGEVESNKSVSQLFAPIGGEVIEVNGDLGDAPETLNDDPYGEGWLIKIAPMDPNELQNLMTHEEYSQFIEELD